MHMALMLGQADWATRRKRLLGLLPLVFVLVVLLLFARFQPGQAESQHFLRRVDPAWEALQRMRAPYNWVSLWKWQYIAQYLLLWAAGLAAFWRLGARIPRELRSMAVGVAAIGLVGVS